MAGIGKELCLGKKALDASFEYLVDDWGAEIVYPPYSRYHVELGEISSYPQGVKENGAVFNHNNPWLTIACCEEDEPERAFELYRKNAPSYIEDRSEIHRTEPYVYSQMIAGRSSKSYGQAKNSWLTGSATWSFVCLSQGILGIIPQLDGLMVKPCLAKEMKEASVTRKIRGKVFRIHILNSGKGEYQLIVNGKSIQGNLIPYEEGVGTYDVEAVR